MTVVGAQADTERGSVSPLMIGIAVCLLLIGFGAVAAGSAFLSRQSLQNLCDGAAAAAANAAAGLSPAGGVAGGPEQVATEYLHLRAPEVTAMVALGAETVQLTCHQRAEVTMGELFLSPTIDLSVTAVGRPYYRP